MKTTALILILFLTGLDLWAQTNPPARVRQLPQRFRAPGATNGPLTPATTPVLPGFSTSPASTPSTMPITGSPSDASAPSASGSRATPEETIPAGTINFQGVDVNQVLEVYAQLVGRTLLRAGLPSASIVLKTQTPLTKTEAIQALQAVLALNGISVVNVGDKFVKVLPSDVANSAAAPIDSSDATNLPELGSYVTHIVQLKYVKPSDMVQVISPFAKLQNSIVPIDANQILVLRDYAENVKRMLEMIDRVDIGGGNSELISEVIPIKYALAEDIANALNSLGGNGGSTVSIGTPATSPSISGVSGATRPGGTAAGVPGSSGYQSGTTTQQTTGRGYGTQATTTANGTPTGGTTFQQRLQSIINRASGGAGQQDQIQVFGQAKIIADQRANSLLVFATRADMDAIKSVVAKLDVLLSQVLVEAIIMDVDLQSGSTLGVSAAQNPKTFSSSVPIVGGGGMNNGQSFFNFLATNSLFNLGTNAASIFGNALPGGFSYFGNIGPSWDVAVQAAENDSTTTIVQRPRIQTSQAKQAQFFVGETRPYVTSTYNGGAGIGQSSSYSQLSVGVELDVTPFINPDGLVVMDINQEIDDFNGFTTIEGVGDVPNTDKRTINSEIAVKDRDTIILGGFVKTEKDKTRAGVPILMDIPWIGSLFTERTDSKDRHELVVLMRPTVLKTPEIAAQQAVKEEQRLPGVSAAAAEESADERRLINAERKKEESRAKSKGGYPDGFFTVPPQETTTNINSLMATPLKP
jgi:general secretion pathway protein D